MIGILCLIAGFSLGYIVSGFYITETRKSKDGSLIEIKYPRVETSKENMEKWQDIWKDSLEKYRKEHR